MVLCYNIADSTVASATVDTTTKVITLNGDFDNPDTSGNFISASDAQSAIETATSKTLTSVTGTAVATATAAESGVYVAPVTGVTEKVAITITGTATSAGTLTVVAGTKTYNITVANEAVQNDVAAAIHTAINARCSSWIHF